MARPAFPFRLLGLCALLAPGSAFAKSVAVAQLLAQGGLDPKQAENIGSLISSELDFMSDFDDVIEVPKAPSNASCLQNVSCLKGLAGKGDTLIAGVATSAPGGVKLDLVFFDNAAGSIVRAKQYSLPSAPDKIADAMNNIVNEVVKGQTREQAKAAETNADSFNFGRTPSGDDDDFAFDDFDPAAELRKAQEAERRKAEEAARAKAEADARARAQAEAARAADEQRRVEEQRRAQEAARQAAEQQARAQAEAQARARADAEAKARADAEARARADAAARAKAEAARQPTPPSAGINDASMITFGESKGQITVEEIDNLIQFAAPTQVAVEYASPPPPRPTSGSTSRPPANLEDLDDEELDRPPRPSTPKATNSPKPSTGSSTTRPPSESKPSVQLALRGGYSKYFALDFLTYGAELTIPLGGSGLGFNFGFEAYSTHRDIPPELWEELGRIAEWNTIFPLNAGLVYKIGDGPVRPYLGGDVVGAQYYIDANRKSYFSMGGRARLGADIRLADHVALNLNLGVGAWQGAAWPVIEPGIEPIGLLPQISGGLLFSF